MDTGLVLLRMNHFRLNLINLNLDSLAKLKLQSRVDKPGDSAYAGRRPTN